MNVAARCRHGCQPQRLGGDGRGWGRCCSRQRGPAGAGVRRKLDERWRAAAAARAVRSKGPQQGHGQAHQRPGGRLSSKLAGWLGGGARRATRRAQQLSIGLGQACTELLDGSVMRAPPRCMKGPRAARRRSARSGASRRPCRSPSRDPAHCNASCTAPAQLSVLCLQPPSMLAVAAQPSRRCDSSQLPIDPTLSWRFPSRPPAPKIAPWMPR